MIIAAWVIGGLIVVAALAWLGLYRLGTRMGQVHADEVHMVVTPDLWRIRLCRYKSKKGAGEPVFFCHGFMSNQFNFTLPDGEAIVDYLTQRGYDCWTIDLRGNLSSVAPYGRTYDDPTMDDYLLKDIPAALDFIRKTTGLPRVHWIGHSMGGMLFYAYNATFGGAKIASATTLGSPIGFEGLDFHNPGLILCLRRLIGRLASRGVMRVLLSLFVRLKPRVTLVPVAFSNLHAAFFDPDTFFLAADTPPIKVAEDLAQAAMLKTWMVNNGQIDVFASLRRLHTPLFAIFGAADPLVPAQTVDAFFEKVTAPNKKMLLLSKDNGFADDYSHLDLVFGKEAPGEVFQPIVDWLKAHPVAKQALKSDTIQPKLRAPRKKPPTKKTAAKKAVAKKPAARKRGAKS
ncbi:MAG TPA: alpha/beta hydrolase [Candidatus Bathyarchaeia archaeon]|nr:alpha/beta hydrolase [Candidatus Bathyarchaeia archaeon]